MHEAFSSPERREEKRCCPTKWENRWQGKENDIPCLREHEIASLFKPWVIRRSTLLKHLLPCLPHSSLPSNRRTGAMTMAETVIRKACDRCHAQKLSCKRYNDEPCERCVRLKTECKSSPSLRYRKQQQQQQQQLVDNNSNHLQGQLPPTSSTPAPTGRRSPKRRRTDSQGDASLVPPDAGTCHSPFFP